MGGYYSILCSYQYSLNIPIEVIFKKDIKLSEKNNTI